MKQFFLSISSWKKQHKKLYQSNLNNVKIILIETIFCWDAFQSGKTVSYHLLVPVQITRFIPSLCPKIYWHLHKRICQNSFQLFASITFKILRAASSLTVKQDKIWEFIARKITVLLIWIWISIRIFSLLIYPLSKELIIISPKSLSLVLIKTLAMHWEFCTKTICNLIRT